MQIICLRQLHYRALSEQISFDDMEYKFRRKYINMLTQLSHVKAKCIAYNNCYLADCQPKSGKKHVSTVHKIEHISDNNI